MSLAEHEASLALARAILPEGRRFPAAGADTLARAERLVGGFGSKAVSRFALLAETLDRAALLSTGRRFSRLGPKRQERLLRRWERDPLLRLPLYGFAMPLKTVHFDSPEAYSRFGIVYERGGTPEPARWWSQVTPADELDEEEELEADVVVVGTGAGGAVVGKELAERGHAVVFLEEGEFHRRDAFRGNAIQGYQRFYRSQGGVFALGNAAIPVFMGRMVGGSTTINTATCFRTPAWVLDEWCERLGTDELSPAAFERHFERVERHIGVETARPEVVGGAARIVARGCEALGWNHFPPRRNAPECDAQGVCNFGCPTGAKRSMDMTYIPSALMRSAMLVTGAKVHRVLVENGRAVGVEATSTRSGKALRVRAQVVVLAGGAVPTPVLLLQQGIANSSGLVGTNLSLHPATGAAALFDETVRQWDGLPQGYCSDEFHHEGILMLGASILLSASALAFQMTGQRLMDVMDDYDRVASFGVMIEDDTRGRVRQVRGSPRLSYRLGAREVGRLQRGIGYLSEIFFAAGARRVFPLMPRLPVIENRDELARFRKAKFRPWDFIMTSFHPLGTCPMGNDPKASVVGIDHETHDVRGLFIVDGSTVPGPPAVNPQITIMAMASRAAEKIDARLA